MALLLQCFSCTKPSYVDMDIDYSPSYTYISSHQVRYIHRPCSQLETIKEDIDEDAMDAMDTMDDGQSLVDHSRS